MARIAAERVANRVAYAFPLRQPLALCSSGSLGMDFLGMNWFSDTSDGKSHALYVATRQWAGLMGPHGLPSWADFRASHRRPGAEVFVTV